MARIRFAQDPGEMLWIAFELMNRLPHLRDGALFAASVPQFMSLPGCKFVIATDDRSDQPCALGLIALYRAPAVASHIFAVEAMWFRDEALETQLWIWAFLSAYVKKLDFAALCVTEKSVITKGALEQLVQSGGFVWDGDHRHALGRGQPLLQGTVPGLYSVFSEGAQSGSAFYAPCVMIVPLAPVDWSGVPDQSQGPLYRGEGRLKVDGAWDCGGHTELLDHLRRTGFAPRTAEHRFSGSVPEQILQQGYVNQNTVSLTGSFDVAVQYATDGGRRDSGVVLTIDRERLRQYAPVHDAFASMRKYLDWFFGSEFETLVKLVSVLGVLEGGMYLSRCDTETRELVESGRDLFADPPIWPGYFAPGKWDELEQAGILEDRLSSLYDAFQSFWRFALGQVGSVHTIVADLQGGERKVTERRVQPLGYYYAFREVADQLREVQARATEDHIRHPGWQTTPFGYVAKTCRDQEFFSSGRVPGDCIVDATVVSLDRSLSGG